MFLEMELAFVLATPLEGTDCTLEHALAAIDYAVPALEVLNPHIELEGRTIVDTIADNAAYGARVLGLWLADNVEQSGNEDRHRYKEFDQTGRYPNHI